LRNRVSGRRRSILLVSLAGLLIAVGSAQATHLSPDTFGHTTAEDSSTPGAEGQLLEPVNDPAAGYTPLEVTSPGEDYTVRDRAFEASNSIPDAQAGRDSRRQSLAYFSQMTDFQLADEESPSRVEFLDQGASSAWRPMEAFAPFMIDASIRQINAFAQNSPFPGSDSQMDIALVTGDQADNNQRNETVWVRELLEGGQPLNFNSGSTNAADYSVAPSANYPQGNPSCVAYPSATGIAEAPKYTGVQDYDDYPVAPNQYYYDPDQPAGTWLTKGWPTYGGLMDRAQQITITPEGLDPPFYITNGNHDVLVQGNEDANAEFENIAMGCQKVLGTTATPPAGSPPDPNSLFLPTGPPMLVPPDPQRQFVSKQQIKQIYGASIPDDDDHGFGLVDPAENAASNNSASYYAWDPPEMPGFRFISVDTNSEGGQTAEGVASGSSNGNIDHPQFQWLERELAAAQEANKLIVVFGHHPVRSMTTLIADEQAGPCQGQPNDEHGHPQNPGCDSDPRFSEPLHLGQGSSPGETFVSLMSRYPNMIAYVPGHTHENRVTPFTRQDGTAWWELNTSAVIDSPTQSRLMEIFDNKDGTLSIFSAVTNLAADSTAPPGCSTANCAGSFTNNQLASIGRTFAYNDPQPSNGAGAAKDRNVELLLDDPRDGVPNPPAGPPGAGPPGGGPNPPGGAADQKCKGKAATIVGTENDDSLEGTDEADVIVALGGDDDVKGGGGNDVICGKGGNDDLRGNGGKDKLRGGGGNDNVKGGGGNDVVGGGAGKDKVGGGGGQDRCNGGTGRDRERSCE